MQQASRSQTITKDQEFTDRTKIETIDLAKKTNALRMAAVATNKPAAEPPSPPTPAPDWQPALTGYVAPKDPNTLWPALLIALLLILTTELMRRHRRRRKRRYIPAVGQSPSS